MNDVAHATESAATNSADTHSSHAFQAEVQEVLRLVVHSLYSHKEIFLRELVSNAADACDKLRYLALKDETLLEGDSELRIEIEADASARTLTIRDNGIGMSRDEVVENIGTIARSGTRRFMEQMAKEGGASQDLIGQFGVGFYSAFIVAERVELASRRAGEAPEAGVRWSSEGQGSYTLADETRGRHGTEVVLHLKPEESEFLQSWTLESLVRRYSDHIGFPIRLRKETDADEDADAEKTGDDSKTQSDWETVNQASALWALPRSEIREADYQSFYKHIAHDFEDALAWAHNNVEGSQNYTSLLYLPGKAPLDFMLQRDERHGLRLYVKRVFIMDAAEQLLPHYLRFVRGVVDSSDLPLNVSRELLQENEQLRKIRAAVIKRTLDLLTRLAKDEGEKFATFWKAFGTVLKEGIVEDHANRDKIAGLLRFTSTRDIEAGQVVSLTDYIARLPEGQEEIWYLTGESLNAVRHSPHLEAFRAQGIEVLLLSDRIDEWMMGYFTEFEGKKLRSVAKGELPATAKKTEATETTAGQTALLEKLQEALAGKVSAVRASARLTESLACLVLAEHDMALHMQRMLQAAGQAVPAVKPTLEVNLAHPLLARLESVVDSPEFGDWAELIHAQALLAEGGQLEDPAAFVSRLNRLLMV